MRAAATIGRTPRFFAQIEVERISDRASLKAWVAEVRRAGLGIDTPHVKARVSTAEPDDLVTRATNSDDLRVQAGAHAGRDQTDSWSAEMQKGRVDVTQPLDVLGSPTWARTLGPAD